MVQYKNVLFNSIKYPYNMSYYFEQIQNNMSNHNYLPYFLFIYEVHQIRINDNNELRRSYWANHSRMLTKKHQNEAHPRDHTDVAWSQRKPLE